MVLKALDVNKVTNFVAKYRKAVADQKLLQVVPPTDLETELISEIAAKVAEIRYYRDHRPASREEYIAGLNALKDELSALLTTNLGIQQRNQVKWDAAQAVFNADFDALQATIDHLEDKEKQFLDNLTTDPVP
jgi:homogentisate 1,2-dioxygenase